MKVKIVRENFDSEYFLKGKSGTVVTYYGELTCQ